MNARYGLLAVVLIFGPMVLLSYYLSAQHNPAGMDALWGDIPENLKVLYPIGMLAGAIGFFPFTYLILRYSGQCQKYIFPYLLIFLPSIAWMPLTVHYIQQPADLTWMAIRVVLILVPLGAYLILRYIRSEFADRDLSIYNYALWGLYAFIAHTLLLDGIIWPWFF